VVTVGALDQGQGGGPPAVPAWSSPTAGAGPGGGPAGQAPAGWRELLVAPLVAQGRHLGVIVLGNLERPEAGAGAGMRLRRQDLQLLSPLASGLAVTLGNATQVAQIKEEKSTLEQILGLSSDGILLLDGKGRVRVWNQAMERICGVPADEAVGLPYNEWLAGLDPRPPRPARGPPPRCRSAPPRAWSGGCAATTRCCTRVGSGPPTW
jgi:PAS domain-containing protein